MIHSQKPAKPILAAVGLNGKDDALLKAARQLARKLHAPLHMVHAMRPIFHYVGAGDLVMNPYYGYEMSFHDKEEQTAADKLGTLADAFDDIEIKTHLVRDYPADALLSLSEELDAGLIVVSVSPEASAGGFLTGTSTGFTLASEADIPVLLVPEEATVNFEAPLRILVADNLEEEGKAALAAASMLANELHAESLLHMHVQDMSYQDVDRMVESVRESMLRGQVPSDPDLNRDYYIEKVKARTRSELVKRYESGALVPLNSTRYETAVAFGKPSEEVQSEVARIGAGLMIFGRHHRLHRKTLSLGRIPYSAMVEGGVATLVVPEMGRDPAKDEARKEAAPDPRDAQTFLNHL